ncbi:MAG: SGNH/GDSL hydrolase family protein [Lachnospiraceae bacterium]|nr:SGNH/GDSL hydrolase family protein [Lachnospiraceae bacterium]
MQIKRFINIHTILLAVFLLMIGGIVYRFFHWGQKVDPHTIIAENRESAPDVFDLMLPVMDEDHNIIEDKDDTTTIVCFGNAPFADDRESADNLANMIAARTGATVYNCSVAGSYLAAENPSLDTTNHPMDAFNFYWLAQLSVKAPIYGRYERAALHMGDAVPAEGQMVYDTLWNMNFEDVDVIVIMYDGSDYLDGRAMYDDFNATNIECFTGNLEAGIELFQQNYPWIRIIVMSPAYAFAVDEDGAYISSDQYTYGWDVLSTYVIKEFESCFARSVTFVDHLYGTINEDVASDYLIDNLHLNKAGRELVADRFVTALHYFD